MADSYRKVYIHYVFSTKQRQPIIKPEFEKKLWSYIGGIGREIKCPVLACGGMPDHVHLLISISSTSSISKTIQVIKANSSRWLNEMFFESNKFKWQAGYGAFSISQSGLKSAIRYIQNQKTHHEKMTFKEEYVRLLKKYNVEYNEKYL